MTKQMFKKVMTFTVALALLAGFAPVHSVPSARALSAASVTVVPNTVGERAKYTVEFTLGKALATGDEIWLYFPKGTFLPCTTCNPRILQTTVTVNGAYPIFPSIGNATTGIVQVYVPNPLKDGEQVTMVVDSSAGVRNPTTGGVYVLGISTSTETKRVDSSPFGIGASRVSDAVVHLTDSSIVGKNSAYLVNLVTGYGGALAAGTGTVTLTFPEGTVVPPASTGGPSSVSVNGVAAQHVETNPVTRTVVITVPVAVNAVDLLSISLPSSFGLVNPDKRGEYTLFAHTSAEVGDVRSDPYVVEDVPAVATAMVITPPAPEGEDMWYLHTPTVALNAQSNKDGTLSTWYAIDDAPLAQYTQPFLIPDGVHTLRYMSKNETAGLEEEVHTTQVKVELSAPAVTFSEGNGAILTSESTMTLHGTVAPSASGIAAVEIGGQPVSISTLQAVTAKLLLMEGANDISVLTRTNAGNARLAMVRVVLDTTPPAISITSHKNWQVVTTPTIVVKGQAEENATVVFNGTTVVTAPDGSFEQSVALKPGQNGIAVTATDEAGNRRTASVIVMYESQGPKTTISMTIGSPAMTVNGTTLALDINPLVVPVIRLGRTLVPVRSIVQALGGQVVWDAKTQHVTLTLATHKVVLTINQSMAVVDGKSARIDTADAKVVPIILNRTTMVPFRFFIEALGGSVQWDGTLRTITIFYPKP